MKTQYTVSQTYQTVTPESAELGDFEDQGYEFEDYDMTISDVLRELREQGNEYLELFGDELRIYGWTYTIDYKTGEDKTRCLHVYGKKRNLERLKKIIESRG